MSTQIVCGELYVANSELLRCWNTINERAKEVS
jgi:hypothetical protein